jgi:hypothetical protein
MPRKVMLPNRLEAEVIERLHRAASARNVTINDLLALAVDALEREQSATISLQDRVALLEKNLGALCELIATFWEKIEGKFGEASVVFSEKMAEASANEKERLRSLLLLLKAELEAHDKAEEARFLRIKPTIF